MEHLDHTRGATPLLAALWLVGCLPRAPESPLDRPADPASVTGSSREEPAARADGFTVLAEEQAPTQLVVADGWVYWIDHYQEIRRVSIRGGEVTTLVRATPEDRSLTALALDGDQLYYATFAGGLHVLAAAGGPVTTLATSDEGASMLAIGPRDIFWGLSRRVRHGPPVGAILRVPKTGGPATTIAQGISMDEGFAHDAAALYLSTGQEILRIAFSDGAITRVSAALPSGEGITARTGVVVADATGVYWAQSLFAVNGLMNASTVAHADPSGKGARVIADVPGSVTSLRIDGAELYLTAVEVGSGGAISAVLQVPTRGGTPTPATELPFWSALAFDATYLYMASHPGGSAGEILRRPKPTNDRNPS